LIPVPAVVFFIITILSLPIWAGSLQGTDLLTGQAVEVKPGPKGMVVVFLSAKCPCSNNHVSLIKNLALEFSAVPFVAIHSNADEDGDTSRDYFESVSLGFPIIQDSNGQIADQFSAKKTPHAFLVSAEGHTLYRGGVTESKNPTKGSRNILREALEDLVAGNKIRTASARTLGCSIVRGRKIVK
jgi:hypothetical protein